MLGSKWTYERVDKSSDETINKTYAEYIQRELNEKGEKTGKALGKHIINLLLTITTSSPKPKGINKMIDSFKKVIGYIIEGACNVLSYILKYIPGTQEACNKEVRRKPRL